MFHKSRCFIPLVKCGISDAYTHAWLSSSMIVASFGNPTRINIPLIARASSFKHWFTAYFCKWSFYDSCLWISKYFSAIKFQFYCSTNYRHKYINYYNAKLYCVDVCICILVVYMINLTTYNDIFSFPQSHTCILIF